MTTTELLRDRAMLAVAAVPANTEGSRRLRAVKILRDSVKASTGRWTLLGPLVDAVDWAIEQERAVKCLTDGADLDYVFDQLDAVDPIDVESEDPSDTDYEVHRALNYVRAQIIKRKAVQAGPRADVDYCGLDGKYGRACGPDLGLPQCGWHGRVDAPAVGQKG